MKGFSPRFPLILILVVCVCCGLERLSSKLFDDLERSREEAAWKALGEGLEKAATRIASSGSVDCGLYGPYGAAFDNTLLRSDAEQCAIEAFQAGKPFIMREAFPGADTVDYTWWVRTEKGDVYRIRETWISMQRGNQHWEFKPELCSAQIGHTSEGSPRLVCQ